MTRFLVFIFALFAIGAAYGDDIICSAGQYLDDTNCIDCPIDYPNSDPSATSATECYSDLKPRDCGAPAGCASASTCHYVAYGKNIGTIKKPIWGDGEVKSGCEVCPDYEWLSALPGFRVNGLSCKICPAGTFSPGGDATTCEPCPDGATTLMGASSRDECMRILNYLPPDSTIPNKIYLAMKKITQPSLAVQVGDNVFYGNMTPIPDDKTLPGMNIKYDDTNYSVSSNMGSSAFYIITTPDTTEFSFSMSAIGKFFVYWGDGTVENIIRDNTTEKEYSHTYDAPGEYTIGFNGRAAPEAYNIGCGTTKRPISVISFQNNKSVAKIGGSLGSIFPTLSDGSNTSFAGMFYGCTNLRGEIPIGLFGNLSGKPYSCMFQRTFYNTPNLTGPTARNPDGTPLYDIEYNGAKWIDAYPTAFTGMYTNSGIISDF